ncbi:MAG: hypothetical protein AAGF24_08440 [Cyanobacteria bacterium P01_H01_bin.121]
MSFVPERQIRLKISPSAGLAAVLTGLQTWSDLGLWANDRPLQLKAQLTEPQHESLELELQADVAASITANIAPEATGPNTSNLQSILQSLAHLPGVQLQGAVTVATDHPQLLQGLDCWLELKLISPQIVQELCATHLIEPLPETTHTETSRTNTNLVDEAELAEAREPETLANPPLPRRRLSEESKTSHSTAQPSRRTKISRRSQQRTVNAASMADARTNTITEGTRGAPDASTRTTPIPGWLQWGQHLWRSLIAELSVLWLLLLGVFMVIVSSGVLAANQWDRFPPSLQYGVLWIYTLLFWGAHAWTRRQANLRLTSQALQIITLLLVPVNFVAIDSFALWGNPVQWLVAIAAIMSLCLLTLQLFRPGSQSGSQQRQAWQTPSLRFSLLLLSLIQLGWALPRVPILASYIGVLGVTALTQLNQAQKQQAKA